MSKVIMLDSGPLGALAHPRANPRLVEWIAQLRASSATVIVPEIADYEVRRNLLLEGKLRSVERLDVLKTHLGYAPISTTIMLRAAALWAAVRRRGRPTADPKELDGDVILAAQALEVGAVIATENVGHLALFVEARPWREITP